jgi:DNA helicase II / ATP-dependent DNA helicase PcrA
MPGASTVPAWNDGLSGVALDIASSDDARLRVLAGPGTGKTYALKRLVMRLLDRGDDPERILVVTFTRTAAADLRQEMSSLGVSGCERIVAGTLHSVCFRILLSSTALAAHNRIPRTLIQVKKHSGILGFEYAPLLKDLGSDRTFGDVRARIKLIRAYEAAWARQQQQPAGVAATTVDQRFESALKEWLMFHESMLIGELVPEALNYLDGNPLAPERTQFDRVIVDEYQDLNKAEQSIIDLLAQNGTLMIVGDEDQSIYSFRHANPDGIADFINRHAGTVDKTLGECRRCGHSIVTAANNLISVNHVGSAPPFSGMALDPTRPTGEIHVVQWPTLGDEIQDIADYVGHVVNAGVYGAGDILIMTPRRRIGYQIRNAIRRLGVQAHSFFHEEVLEADDSQEAFTLLTLLANNEDRVALRFWLGFGSNTWLTTQYTRLRTHCETTGDTPWDALDKMDSGALPSVGYANLLSRFRLLKTKLAPLANLAGGDLIDALFPAGADWADPLREMLMGSSIDTLTDAPELLTLVRDYVTQPEIPTHPDFVRIMSLHASKGLTAKVAVVTSVVDSLIPNSDLTATAVERSRAEREQRRLFYVAITRGRDVLVLSSPASIPPTTAVQMNARIGNNGRTFPSSFLRELRLPPGTTKSGPTWAAGGYI